MWKYLDKLRSKNDTEKKSFALIVSATLTIIIAIVWFISVYAVSSSDSQENKTKTPSPVQNIRSQFNIFTE